LRYRPGWTVNEAASTLDSLTAVGWDMSGQDFGDSNKRRRLSSSLRFPPCRSHRQLGWSGDASKGSSCDPWELAVEWRPRPRTPGSATSAYILAGERGRICCVWATGVEVDADECRRGVAGQFKLLCQPARSLSAMASGIVVGFACQILIQHCAVHPSLLLSIHYYEFPQTP
jgi:hypothetical protein